MVEIIGYVALALGFIAVIVSNVVAAQKKKQQLMERTNNYEKEFEESKYQENVLTYTFVRLKKIMINSQQTDFLKFSLTHFKHFRKIQN